MNDICADLHLKLDRLQHYHFPFDETKLPLNGIYILFEDGEKAHGTNRIVRVGTHTGQNHLPSRLNQHFLEENKDRSIFRKNIGRALLNKRNDPFLEKWELDLTTREAKDKYGNLIDPEKLRRIEHEVSIYIQSHFQFMVFPVPKKEDRLLLESRIISTVSLCKNCRPSADWLGLSSPKEKIRQSGLWIVNELYKRPLSQVEFGKLTQLF
ncbi:MAG: hypothetical protein WC837_01860 [Bellilinea sp.]